MKIFDNVMLGCIFISFPLLVYLFYLAHNQSIEKRENDLFLGLALFSSMYLLVKLGQTFLGSINLLLINIPIIVAYIKNRPKEASVLSLLVVFYYAALLNHNLALLLIEYGCYYGIYLLREKKALKMDDYTFGFTIITIKSINYIIHSVTSLHNHDIYISYFIVLVLLTYFTLFFIIFILKKGDEIIKYHMTFKQLEKEKQIRQSLFQITHEIKNPLAVCKGYLDMIDTKKQAQCEKYIPILKEEIDRTLLLLQDFLAVNRIKLNVDILDINLLLEESIKSLNALLNEKNIELEFEEEDEIYINGDYNRLIQVVVNIIKNSVEAIEDKSGGKIKITTETKDKCVHISFEDNGMGIKKENLEKIKEPFFTTKSRGTGLGVSLSHEIVSAHKGEMNYESEYGNGTKVTILLPLIEEY